MYGLINIGLLRFIEEQYGLDVLTACTQSTPVTEASLCPVSAYDDDITYQIVGDACRLTGTDPNEFLRLFGRFWVLTVAARRYAYLLNMSGPTFIDCVDGLDLMHERIATQYKNLRQPSFTLRSTDDPREYILEYRSSRSGMRTFVIGLIEGLSEYFETPCEVQFLEGYTEPEVVEEFLLRLVSA